jgi:gamma-glutamylaminecyclotransferase
MNRIFVFGSLKNGQPNFWRMTDPDSGLANFVSGGQTADTYPMVINPAWNLPCLLNIPGSGMVGSCKNLLCQ